MKSFIDREQEKLAKQFNIVRFFEEKGVKYKSRGENIGRGWIGIESCPFCGKGGYHYGLHQDTKRSSCWVCGSGIASKNIHFLIHKLIDCSISQAKKYVLEYQDSASADLSFPSYAVACEMPPETHIYSVTPRKLVNYFEQQRGFDDGNFLASKYGLMMTRPHALRPNSILFPYFYQGEFVTYVTRSIVEKGYKTAPISKSVIDAKRTLYNIDSCSQGQNMLVVEGPIDVLKVGHVVGDSNSDNVCGTNGTKWTFEQVLMIVEKRPSKVFVCYDSLEIDAQSSAQKLVDTLSFIGIESARIELSQTANLDPGGLNVEQVKRLRKKSGI